MKDKLLEEIEAFGENTDEKLTTPESRVTYSQSMENHINQGKK